MPSLPHQRYPLGDMDLSQFVSAAPSTRPGKKCPTSPVKMSPSKRRILRGEGLQVRTYKCAPYPASQLASSPTAGPSSSSGWSRSPSPIEASAFAPEKQLRMQEEGREEFQSHDPSSAHYCGFIIYRQSSHASVSSPIVDLSHSEDMDDLADSKENALPSLLARRMTSTPSLRSSTSQAPKLVFPAPQPLDFGSYIPRRPQPTRALPGAVVSDNKMEDIFL